MAGARTSRMEPERQHVLDTDTHACQGRGQLCGYLFEYEILLRAALGKMSDMHPAEPSIDDEIAYHIPAQGITSLLAVQMGWLKKCLQALGIFSSQSVSSSLAVVVRSVSRVAAQILTPAARFQPHE
jgi:hypothetical protein